MQMTVSRREGLKGRNMCRPNENTEYEPIGEPTVQYIKNPIEDDSTLKIQGYKHDFKGSVIYHMLGLLFLGIPYVLFFWYPSWRKARYKLCPLSKADYVFVSDSFGNTRPNKVYYESNLRYFVYQHTKYLWNKERSGFSTADEFADKCTLEELLEKSEGLFEDEENVLLLIHGPNKIEVKIKSYWKLFVEEVFNPFYIFQIFSTILWFVDEYVIYAGTVVFLTMVSSITALIQTRKQSVALHHLVKSSDAGEVTIKKRKLIDTEFCTINAEYLVPGHVLVLPRSGCIMPCDAVLISGNCIVNESMLTGESVPVWKTPPNPGPELYDINLHKAHTLFSGTQVIQGRFYGGEHILARVVRTGFNTTKGSLVKSIMFPTPIGFKFHRESLKFVFTLFIVASVGVAYSLYMYIQRNAELKDIIIRTLDIFTIVVPPALPAAMTVGIVYSQNRLKKLGIFCISPMRINVCGKLKLACFDKTGTLTHEGLDLYTVVPAENQKFQEAVNDVKLLDDNAPLVQGMATCHSLTRIDGKLNGDPLDLIMFKSTNWILEEPGQEDTNYDMLAPTIVKPERKYVSMSALHNAGDDLEMPYEIGIIKQFQFSSSLQRMSVICRILSSPNMLIFTKGAPERISSMCIYETIPPDFNNRLAQFTAQGFRVIAVGYKELPKKFKFKDAHRVKREMVECDLIFLGFIVMRNTLKPETTPVISILQSANIRTVMITGDNVMTAICVARECGMVKINDDVVLLQTEEIGEGIIPRIYVEHIGNTNGTGNVVSFNDEHYHFAMDGKTWANLKKYYPDLLPKLLLRATIFARFEPSHKTQLVTHLQKLDYIVSMVGDGANDCGALKAAHIGVSLSQAEASVAAPFTSSIENISCLIHLVLEGRCALVTSFAVFKYMALYSLIQFITIIVLYKHNSILGDQQFLYIDLIITTTLAATIGLQGPYSKLVPKRPMGSLTSGVNLIPMFLQVGLCAAFQYGAFYYLTQQEWYQANHQSREEIILCWENTVLFTVSCFQYIILAVIYSKGRPYRESPIRNFWLLITILTLLSFTTYLCIYPSKGVAQFFDLIYLERTGNKKVLFRDSLLLFPMAHMLSAYIVELLIAESKWLKIVVHFITRKKQPKNKFKVLIRETDFHAWFHQGNDRIDVNMPITA